MGLTPRRAASRQDGTDRPPWANSNKPPERRAGCSLLSLSSLVLPRARVADDELLQMASPGLQVHYQDLAVLPTRMTLESVSKTVNAKAFG